MDNFYTNVPLVEELYGRKIQVTGTVRQNRRYGISSSVKDARNDIGTSSASRKGPLLALSFRQIRSQKQPGVVLLSTIGTAEWVNENGDHVPAATKKSQIKTPNNF